MRFQQRSFNQVFTMTKNAIIGIDLAKTVFQIAVMSDNKVTSNKPVNRKQLRLFMVNHPVTTVAIIEASQRLNLRFVPMKTTHQQDIQCLHRIRDRLARNRTGLSNQTRGLLTDYGIVMAKGKKGFLLGIEQAMNDIELSNLLKSELEFALQEFELISRHIAGIESQLRQQVEQDCNAKILHSMPGIGVINATALTCKYGDASQFNNSRGLPVSLGLTPKLNASGHRAQMQGISKRGNPYLRKQLIHGARALWMICDKRPDAALCRWASRLKKRRGQNVAVAAIANRLARLAWVLLNKQEMCRPMPN
jgi:transposase